MNLFVGNLSPETTEEHLRQLFSEFGNIVLAKVLIDPATGMPRGFGFVEMEQKYDAFDAMDNLDATYFMGQVISVKEAKGKQPARGGGQKRSGGFQKRSGFSSDKKPGFQPTERKRFSPRENNFNSNRDFNKN